MPILFLHGAIAFKNQLLIHEVDSAFDEKEYCTATGLIDVMEVKDEKVTITLRNVEIQMNNTVYKCDKILAFISGQQVFKIGNEVTLEGMIYKFQEPTNQGQFNELIYYKMRSIDYKLQVEEARIVNSNYSIYKQFLYDTKINMIKVYHNILPEKEAGMITAMIVGDKGELDKDMKDLYQKSGISHIIAISGLHVTLLGISLYNLLKLLRLPTLVSTIISIFLLYSYGVLTNFSVSTNRAVVMLIVLMLSKVIGRTYDLLSATCLSALIILCQSPLEMYDIGFLLSFGAILAIGILEPIFSNLFPVKSKLIKGLYSSISIQLLTLPIILYNFYEIPSYSILINLIVIPLSSLLILLGALSGLIGLVLLPISKILIGGVYVILKFYEFICNLNVSLPINSILIGRPALYLILTYYVILTVFLFLYHIEKKKRYLSILLFLVVIFIKPTNRLELTFLDVGQGDGIFMMTPTKKTYLIDGGSSTVRGIGKYRIIPFLKSKGIWRLDYVFITHMDEDHISGILEIIEQMEIKESDYYNNRIKIENLIVPRIRTQEERYHELIAQAYDKGINVIYMDKGDVIHDKEVSISCYHPAKDYAPASKNEYSMVLSVHYNNFDLLLTGDVEGQGEEELLAYLKNMHRSNKNLEGKEYDVLKISHHGSKNSTPVPFLELVNPRYSIISYGKNNTYGHPHKELLTRLEEANSSIITTQDAGAITIVTDGNYIRIESYKNTNGY